MADDISVFTLNIWGIGCGISWDRIARVKAISQYLVDSHHDIVLLQEVWVPQDYETLRKATKIKFPFAHFFDNGIIGSGTCVLSRFMIQDTTFHEFSLNGYPHKITHGDWFAGKGLGLCRILYKDYLINVFVSHLHAEYCRNKDIYLAHRVMQGLEAAQWVKLTTPGADLTIYGGDFNTEPTDIPYSLLRHLGCLEDSWTDQGGETCATPYNSYTSSQEKIDCPQGKRIDYILYTAGPNVKARAVECRLPLPETIPSQFLPSKQVSYSDHEGVSAKIQLERLNGLNYRKLNNIQERETALLQSISVMQRALKTSVHDSYFYLCICLLASCSFLGTFTEHFITEHLVIDSLVFIFRFLLVLICIFSAVMGTVFNRREKNALLGAKATLQLILDSQHKLKAT